MKIGKFLIILSLLGVLFSCIQVTNGGDVIVARVGENYLYKSDINKLVKAGMSSSDSTLIVETYINKWARKKILLQKAEINLSKEEIDFDRLVDGYRYSLITNVYRKKIISQYLDTLVAAEDINSFYKENQFNFVLNKNIVMVKYAVFPLNVFNKRGIIKNMKSDKLEDLNVLKSICHQYSNDYSLSDSLWMTTKEFRTTRPEWKKISDKKLLKKNKLIEREETPNLYIARIIDVRKIGELAPISYVKPQIIKIILNKRKLDLVKKMEDQIFADAIKKREFEIYK